MLVEGLQNLWKSTLHKCVPDDYLTPYQKSTYVFRNDITCMMKYDALELQGVSVARHRLGRV